MCERVLEEFLLQTKNKDKIRNFFQGASGTAKTGYLKGFYKTGTSIINGYYVDFGARGIEVTRDETEKFTWQQVAIKIDQMIARGQFGMLEKPVENAKQMSIFDLQGGVS